MPRNLAYDQFEEEEKVALEVAIVFPHYTLSEILPKLFGWKASKSTYYRYHRRGIDELKGKGILDEGGKPTDLAFQIIPIENLRKMIKDISKEITILEKRRQDEYARSLEYKQKYREFQKACEQLEEENRIMKEQLEALEELQKIKEKFDFRNLYNRVRSSLPERVQRNIEKAIERFEAGDYDSAIVKSYLASEVLVRNLFSHLYGEEARKVRKHEDKLKRIWNDEKLEKRKYPGIRLIASLFSTILWYRNKMGAHAELTPTLEAARISIIALLQSIEEVKRLGLGTL